MLTDPVQRAIAAKKNVSESAIDDEDNPRLRWQETIVGGTRVDLRFSLRDPALVVRHLKMAADEIHDISVAAVGVKDPQNRLFLVRARLRALNKKLTGTRWSDDV